MDEICLDTRLRKSEREVLAKACRSQECATQSAKVKTATPLSAGPPFRFPRIGFALVHQRSRISGDTSTWDLAEVS